MPKITAILIVSSSILSTIQNSVAGQAGMGPTSSNTKEKTNITAIQSYYQELRFYVATHLTSARAFVKEATGKSWRELPTPFADDNKKYIFTALVWVRNGKPLVVSLNQFQKSKKLTDTLHMYFRPDGSIAKSMLTIEEITNQGNHIVKGKIQYFDAKGKILRTISATRDMKTDRWSKGGDFSRSQMPFHFKITTLPFYNLIAKSTGKMKK